MKIEKFEHETMLSSTGVDLEYLIKAAINKQDDKTRRHMLKVQQRLLAILVHDFVMNYARIKEGGCRNLLREEIERAKVLEKLREGPLHEKVRQMINDKKVMDALGGPQSYRLASARMLSDLMLESGYLELINKIKENGIESLTPNNQKRHHILKQVFERIPSIIAFCIGDPAHAFYAGTIARIVASKKKNYYVIAKDFFDDFKDVNLKNPTFDHLPANSCGVIRLPYNLTNSKNSFCFKEIAFSTIPTEGYTSKNIEGVMAGDVQIDDVDMGPLQRQVIFSWQEKEPAIPSVCYFNLVEQHKGQTLEESWKVACNTAISRAGALPDEDYSNVKKMLINLLVYINSGTPDIRAFKNTIKYNSVTKEPRAPYLNLEEEEVCLVGYNWKKLPKYSVDQWYSKPHLGWRWCGEKKSSMRLALIKGSMKSRKSKDQVDEPACSLEEED